MVVFLSSAAMKLGWGGGGGGGGRVGVVKEITLRTHSNDMKLSLLFVFVKKLNVASITQKLRSS